MRGINEQYNFCKSKLKVSKRDVNLYTLCRINEKWHDNKMTLKIESKSKSTNIQVSCPDTYTIILRMIIPNDPDKLLTGNLRIILQFFAMTANSNLYRLYLFHIFDVKSHRGVDL